MMSLAMTSRLKFQVCLTVILRCFTMTLTTNCPKLNLSPFLHCIFPIFPISFIRKLRVLNLFFSLGELFPWILCRMYFWGLLLSLQFYETGPDKAITIPWIDNYSSIHFYISNFLPNTKIYLGQLFVLRHSKLIINPTFKEKHLCRRTHK